MKSDFTFKDAVELLQTSLKFGIDPSLEPIRKMCNELGNPQDSYACIQIAGTNGKTSTSRMTAALLNVLGFRVGLYTSPHLVQYPERIEIDGSVICDDLFAKAIEVANGAARKASVCATEFELLTCAALWAFAKENVDWAVLECGLGGRWDATSVVTPKVAVITGIALDHTEILGDTLEKIAAEKSAIIKSESTAIIPHEIAARTIIKEHADQVDAKLIEVDTSKQSDGSELSSGFPSYQEQNLELAIAITEQACGRYPNADEIHRAIDSLSIPGRFEILRKKPLVLIDAAHNAQSAQTLARELEEHFFKAENESLLAPPTLLLGVLADKDARAIAEVLCPLFPSIVVTASRSPRALPPSDLGEIVEKITGRKPQITASVDEARDLLGNEPVIATGSITVAGEVKEKWC